MKIAILGGGSWGTALAIHLAKNNHEIKVWEFFAEQANEMQEKRFCRLLPEVKLPHNIFVSPKMEEVLPNCELVLVVVPSDKVEKTVNIAKQHLTNQPLIICSKGFGEKTQLLSELIDVPGNVYGLFGPTHAEEVCKGFSSGIVLAGRSSEERDLIKQALESPSLKVDLSEDLIGVQVCSALKNILAVFVGVLDGKGLGDNSKAMIMTKGLEEIKAIGKKLGAKEETFYGLAGMGDLIVTCTSKHSRNRYVGEQIGKGRKLPEILSEMNMVAEGVTAVQKAIVFKEKFGLELPLIQGLHDLLFTEKDLDTVLKDI